MNVKLSDLSSDPEKFKDKNIETSGKLVQTSSAYFPKAEFALTNGMYTVRVIPWLPLEIAPSPKGVSKKRPNVMSDFLNKYVTITGKVVLQDGKILIEVKNADLSD